MWSVVVLPRDFIRTGISRKSLAVPRGPRRDAAACARSSDRSSSATWLPSGGGGDVCRAAAREARGGTSGAGAGGSSLNGSPSAPSSESASGLNESRPGDRERGDDLRAGDEVHRGGRAVVAAREVAVVGSHDRVRRGRLAGRRRHWPMQGPQALASTVAPTSRRAASAVRRARSSRAPAPSPA